MTKPLVLLLFALHLASAALAAPRVYYDGSKGHQKGAEYRNGRCYQVVWKEGSSRRRGWLMADLGSRWRIWPEGKPGPTEVPKWLVTEVVQVRSAGCVN